MPIENDNATPASGDETTEVRVGGDALDPNAVIINGGEAARREDERKRTEQSAPRRERERDSSRRIDRDDGAGAGDDELGAEVRKRVEQATAKRIGREVAKRHDAERRAEHLEAELRRVSGEARNASEASFVHYEQAAHARLDAAKREAADAYDSGESAKVVEANRKLASAQAAVDNAEAIKARRELEKPNTTATRQEEARPDAGRSQARFTPRTQDWVDENPWFESDPEAKAQALKIHDRLRREGFEIESDDYFEELTRRSKVLFPEHFEDGAEQPRRRKAEIVEDEDAGGEAEPQRARVAASASRTPSPSSAAPSRRGAQTMKLTRDQMEAAAIAGVSPTKYAESLLKRRAAGKVS